MNKLMESFYNETLGEFDYLKLKLLKIIKKDNILELDLSCPRKYGDSVKNKLQYIESVFSDILKVNYTVKVNCSFPIFDKAAFITNLLEFLEKYPFVKMNLKREDISVNIEDIITCKIKLDKNTLDYCNDKKFVLTLNKFARDNYFETINFELYSKDSEFDFSALEKNEQARSETLRLDSETKLRRIKVTDIKKCFGTDIEENAWYIEDASLGEKIFCGTVESLTELRRKPKEGEDVNAIKPFYKFTLKDFTGELNCLYFPNKTTSDKMSEIKNGVTLIARGFVEADDYKDQREFIFKIKSISFCKLPENFTPVIIKRKVPEEYTCVFPKPYVTRVQKDLFGNSEIKIPDYLAGKKFCVFDTETTGLNDSVDSIIEIGAVIIDNGIISQTFQSFINPHKPLTEKIKDLTNIVDEDLLNAPELEAVLSDFYKFCYSMPLVGHNVQFDYGFISKAGKPFNIIFENELIDTLSIAQKQLQLRHNKLDNLAKYYGIVNEGAHRAIYDALTTAKIFIKLSEKL